MSESYAAMHFMWPSITAH